MQVHRMFLPSIRKQHAGRPTHLGERNELLVSLGGVGGDDAVEAARLAQPPSDGARVHVRDAQDALRTPQPPPSAPTQ